MMTSVSDSDTARGGQCDTGSSLTVIVPVWHDARALEALLSTHAFVDVQWVVVNGDPDDTEVRALASKFPEVHWVDGPRGRGSQQNAGAAIAQGAWLLFLHADSALPAGWRTELERVALGRRYVWGCFRLALDASAWQARVIEWGVAARVRWFDLPYGDQGIFVRRDVFQSVGGFPPYPLMEDVALARRLARVGRPYRSPLRVRTSARRWQQEGWWRRSLRNLTLLARYALGASPERLLASYERRTARRRDDPC